MAGSKATNMKIFTHLRNAIISAINTVLLSIVYFLGIGFVSIIAKIFRKKFLDLTVDKAKKTYWNDVEKKSLEDYYRQF